MKLGLRGWHVTTTLVVVFAAVASGCGSADSRGASTSSLGRPEVKSVVRLVEEASDRGLEFKHTQGSTSPLTIVEGMGSGCAFLDFDDDGNLDVFLVNAGQDFNAPKQTPGSRLYRNVGDGKFEDVTAKSGIRFDRYGMGCCAGDYDGDGRVDLFVTGYLGCALYRNLGGGRFADVTQSAGLRFPPHFWGTGCAFFDLNGDSRLDLYVANYVRYDPKVPHCRNGKVMSGCSPNQYSTQPNLLFQNLGEGRFDERTVTLGGADPKGAGLGVLTCDFDDDGKTDVFVANDGTPNALLHNAGGKLRDVADHSGVAFASSGRMLAGMGVDAADYDGDGKFDFIITNYQYEPNSLYRNLGKLLFVEEAQQSGMGAPSMSRLKFGVSFADFDLDGKPDLYVGSGHVLDNVADFEKGATFEQVDQLFHNEGSGEFSELTPAVGALPANASVTRGVAIGDVDNDGAPDVLTNNLGRPARLLMNQSPATNHWLGVDLRGAGGNRFAVGARIDLTGPNGMQLREVRSGGSYLSQSDYRQVFGLGAAANANEVTLTVRWPGGKKTTYHPEALDRYVRITEAGEAAR